MRDRIESLEDKIMSVASQQQKATETEEKTEPSEAVEANDDKEIAKTLADTQPVPSPVYNGIPVYYQIPVTDSAGRVIQHLPVERTERKIKWRHCGTFCQTFIQKEVKSRHCKAGCKR